MDVFVKVKIISNTFPKDCYDQNISKILVSTDTIISLDGNNEKRNKDYLQIKFLSYTKRPTIDAELKPSGF